MKYSLTTNALLKRWSRAGCSGMNFPTCGSDIGCKLLSIQKQLLRLTSQFILPHIKYYWNIKKDWYLVMNKSNYLVHILCSHRNIMAESLTPTFMNVTSHSCCSGTHEQSLRWIIITNLPSEISILKSISTFKLRRETVNATLLISDKMEGQWSIGLTEAA